MKMDIGSSQSWWWESHNRPKHSKWLQENLGDVEANVQTMLTLIEGDADSFAQRAEMYYKKRPDLLKVVEQFYRGYRALAERYDQLTGSIRQIPSGIQAQYGLVSESPRTSPFGKQASYRKHGSDSKETANSFADSNSDAGEFDAIGAEVSSVDEKSAGRSQDGEESSSSSSCSDTETEGSIFQLQQALDMAQAENKRLLEKAKEKQQQYRDTEKRLHGFREDFLRVQKENNTLKVDLAAAEKLAKKLEGEVRELGAEKQSLESNLRDLETKVDALDEKSIADAARMQEEIGFVQDENGKLQVLIAEQEEKLKELAAGLRFMRGTATSLLAKNKGLIEQVFNLTESDEVHERDLAEQRSEAAKLLDQIRLLQFSAEDREATIATLNSKVAELCEQVSELRIENRKQRDAVAETAEEKREAIRQLCFAMDLLNDRNSWLEELVLSAKSKLTDYHEQLIVARASRWRGIFTS